jgi:hypothetical protein
MRFLSTLFLSTAVIAIAAQTAHADELYVGPNGSDKYTVSTPDKPFLTLSKAASVVKAGDTVLVYTGVYDRVTFKTPGTASAPITWKAAPGNTPEIYSEDWAAIKVNANHQVIDGFVLTGGND